MSNTTMKLAAVTLGLLFLSGMTAQPAAAKPVKIPPSVDPGAVLQHFMNNQCLPGRQTVRGLPCGQQPPSLSGEPLIIFVNSAGEPVSAGEFSRLQAVPEATEMIVHPDGTVELR